MRVGCYYLQSLTHEGSSLHSERADKLLGEVAALTGVEFVRVPRSLLSQQPLSLVYVATGGTAGLFRESVHALGSPVILLSVGSDNSLSASMEMLSYLHQQGRKGEILHGNAETIASRLKPILCAARARERLRGMKVGMVGAPSDWLISSGTDYGRLRDVLGLETIDITMEEFLEEIARGGYSENDEAQTLKGMNFDSSSISKALDIYGALSRLVERYNLSGLSVRCFDLLSMAKNTSCLGLALLNSRGIYAGCEGDLPSLLSMMIMGEISGTPVFQCNPSRINLDEGTIVFAHCTLPLRMASRYRLQTHFESGIGVAVSGTIPAGPATIFKTSGDLRRRFVDNAEIETNLSEPDLCRTQIRMKCRRVVELLENPIGNHYLVACGHLADSLEAFFKLLNEP